MPRQRDSKKQNKKKITSLSALNGSVRTTALGAGVFLGAGAFIWNVPTVEAGVTSGTPNVNLTPGGPRLQLRGRGPCVGIFCLDKRQQHFRQCAGQRLCRRRREAGALCRWHSPHVWPRGEMDHGRTPGRQREIPCGRTFWSRTYPGYEKPLKFGGLKIGGMKLGKAGKRKRGHAAIPHVRRGIFSSSSSSTSSGCCSSSGSSTSGFTHHGLLPNNQPFIDQYALFTFQNGPTTLYGWVELSLSIADSYGPNATPNLAVIAWAWDDTGRSLGPGIRRRPHLNPPPRSRPGSRRWLWARKVCAAGARRARPA